MEKQPLLGEASSSPSGTRGDSKTSLDGPSRANPFVAGLYCAFNIIVACECVCGSVPYGSKTAEFGGCFQETASRLTATRLAAEERVAYWFLRHELTGILALHPCAAACIVFANKWVFSHYNFKFVFALTWVHTVRWGRTGYGACGPIIDPDCCFCHRCLLGLG
jgi:hypothetical protein